jgi:hypothetical protein
MPSASDSYGFVDVKAFHDKYPALSTSFAVNAAKESGIDVSNPKGMATVMASRTYQDRTRQAQDAADRKDMRALQRITSASTLPAAPAPGATTEQQFDAGYTAQADAIRQTGAARGILFRQQGEAADKLAKLADFNKSSYKSKRIAELKPTEDLDRQILSLRSQMFTSSTGLREKIKDLPFSQQQSVMAARQKIFTDQIGELEALRKTRLSVAEGQIDEEIDSHEGQVNAAKSRIDAIDSMIKTMEASGDDKTALGKLYIDRAKEMQALKKTRAGNGLATGEEVIYNALVDDYVKTHKVPPNGDAKTELKRQAKQTATRAKVAEMSGGSAAKGVGAASFLSKDMGPGGIPISPLEQQRFDDLE